MAVRSRCNPRVWPQFTSINLERIQIRSSEDVVGSGVRAALTEGCLT